MYIEVNCVNYDYGQHRPRSLSDDEETDDKSRPAL
jgi:hypothetical protein